VMPGSAATAPAPTPSAITDSSDNDSTTNNATTEAASQPAAKPAQQSSNKTASAQDEPMPPVHLTLRQEIMLVRQSCGADFRNYCGNIPLGGGNAVACLHANRARLAPNCKEALAAALLR
jgi:hypothetical protein